MNILVFCYQRKLFNLTKPPMWAAAKAAEESKDSYWKLKSFSTFCKFPSGKTICNYKILNAEKTEHKEKEIKDFLTKLKRATAACNYKAAFKAIINVSHNRYLTGVDDYT